MTDFTFLNTLTLGTPGVHVLYHDVVGSNEKKDFAALDAAITVIRANLCREYGKFSKVPKDHPQLTLLQDLYTSRDYHEIYKRIVAVYYYDRENNKIYYGASICNTCKYESGDDNSSSSIHNHSVNTLAGYENNNMDTLVSKKSLRKTAFSRLKNMPCVIDVKDVTEGWEDKHKAAYMLKSVVLSTIERTLVVCGKKGTIVFGKQGTGSTIRVAKKKDFRPSLSDRCMDYPYAPK